jgi:hypothetical protein|tara:strand:+ start:816 stop:959 length:144 start_codon:yes stop_codon:yes gene_type:complete
VNPVFIPVHHEFKMAAFGCDLNWSLKTYINALVKGWIRRAWFADKMA